MNLDILHISDLHFGNPQRTFKKSEVAVILDTLFRQRVAEEFLIVISGDITFQGKPEGLAEARELFVEALARNGIERRNVLLCPGNHDLIKGPNGQRSFECFDAFSAGLRDDKQCTFSSDPCRLVKHSAADILLLNSAHHLDHQYGLIDLRDAERKIQALNSSAGTDAGRLRLAVTHHHSIPVLHEDVSTIRNAYPMLDLLRRNRFSALLHGHQHALLNLEIGESKMMISGVGSFGFVTPGVINSAVIHRYSDGDLKETDCLGVSLDAPEKVVIVNPIKREASK